MESLKLPTALDCQAIYFNILPVYFRTYDENAVYSLVIQATQTSLSFGFVFFALCLSMPFPFPFL